jgi:predicted GNAT superfamily acetyltransferase
MLTIRPFRTVEEYRACVELQEETWGRGFSERVPCAVLKVARMLGGVASGAWDEQGRLAGFVFGMTGLRDGEVVHWSDMLAVRSGLRDAGLGTRLKAHQRELMVGIGVEKMLWTFDPLRARNAYMNFSKLGIVVREYAPDMYGQSDSPLHRGIGTDRFIALWLLSSARVCARMGRRERGPGTEGKSDADIALAALFDAPDSPRPAEPDLTLRSRKLLVAIPSDIGAVMERDMKLALEWRRATRAVFTTYLPRGYEVRELVRGERTSDYVLAPVAT